jgi:hypothetical protein
MSDSEDSKQLSSDEEAEEYEKDFVVGDSDSDVEETSSLPKKTKRRKSKRKRLRKKKKERKPDKEDLELVMENTGMRPGVKASNIRELESKLFESDEEPAPRKQVKMEEPAARKDDLVVQQESDSERSEGEIMDH